MLTSSSDIIDIRKFLVLVYPEYLFWEPEVLQLELEESKSVEYSDILWEKVQVVLTLQKTHNFYDDAAVFHKVLLVVNNILPSFGIYEYLEPEMIAVGLVEVDKFLDDLFEIDIPVKDLLDYEPSLFCAVCLIRAQFDVCPPFFFFCKDIFDSLNKTDTELASEVLSWMDRYNNKTTTQIPKGNKVLTVELTQHMMLGKFIEDKKASLHVT
jgi:hypothetical protein